MRLRKLRIAWSVACDAERLIPFARHIQRTHVHLAIVSLCSLLICGHL
jgi:hypothetical protein